MFLIIFTEKREEAKCSPSMDMSVIGIFDFQSGYGYMPSDSLLRARRNEKELKVKPATSFKYFQYLLTKN